MKGLCLIVYCHIRWQSNYCKEFYYSLAKSLDGKGQVFCIDRPLAILPDIILRPGELLRSLWKKRVTKITSNLTLYQPIILLHDQIALSQKVLAGFNRWLLRRQILKRLNGNIIDSRVVTYIIEPHQYDYLKIFDNETSIYDCIAEWASYPGLSENEQKRVHLLENKTTDRVDVVFTVSQELHKRRKRIKEAVHYLPWAAEYEHFSKGADLDKCADLLEHKKPYIGFIGNIWGIFDLDLITYIAESLPDSSIILIGSLSNRLPRGFEEKFKKTSLIKNVHWLGYKEHNILPDYLHDFDVCIMPYIIDDWIKTCSPGKFYQYLAQGKPIVSSDIPEVRKYLDEDIVRIAKDYNDFVDKIKIALQEGQADNLILKRQRIAEENSWRKRASDMLHVLYNYPYPDNDERS